MWTSVLDFISLTKQENLKIFPVRIKNWKAAAETCQCFCPWEVSLWGPGGCGNLFCIYIYLHIIFWSCLHSQLLCVCLFFSSSRLSVGSDISGRADSSLSIRFDSALPGSSRNATLQASVGSTPSPMVSHGATRETLESILIALDTEKYVWREDFFFFLNVSPLNLLLWFFLFP